MSTMRDLVKRSPSHCCFDKQFRSRIKLAICLAAMLGEGISGAPAQTNARVVVWGLYAYSQTNLPASLSNAPAKAVAAGWYHSLVLKLDGKVVAWGYNPNGQTTVPWDLSGVRAIAAGAEHNLALASNGLVTTWGRNNYRQCNVPAGLYEVAAVAAGSFHSLALKSNRTVVVWGQNTDGQTNVPAGLSGVVGIAAGRSHSLALKANGTVVGWGSNGYGQRDAPAGLQNVIAIAAQEYHSLALLSNGTVVAWGRNDYGQTNVPAHLTNVIAIAAGGRHCLALTTDHKVIAWGDNSDGQTNVPPALAGVSAIAAGNDHSLAIIGCPRIESPPVSQVVRPGDWAGFQVQVSGIEPMFYQWFFNETNLLHDATNAILQLPDARLAYSGSYYVVVTNGSGSVTSSPVMLTVTESPFILQPHTNQWVWVGGTADFSVDAAGNLPLAYQWFFGGAALLGATNSDLQLTNVQFSQAGAYTVVVTNAFGAVTSAPATLVVYPLTTVPVASEAILRAAMAHGGLITFACDGVITVANTITNSVNTTLDGADHEVTISGADAVRVFYVTSNSAFGVKNLKIANGRSSKGAGIFNDGGRLTLWNVGMEANYADSFDDSAHMFVEAAEGGGLFNRNGVVNAVACTFSGNTAFKPPDDIPSTDRNARGGAIRNESGEIDLQDCRFTNNRATGGPPMGPMLSLGRDGLGGAIHNSGKLTATRCSFLGNSARGEPVSNTIYPAPAGGSGAGGAIYNVGDLILRASTVASNSASGGTGGSGVGGCVMTCPGSPSPGGPGSNGGWASGGGLFNTGTASAINCTLAWNTCFGGAGGPGGNGGPATLPYVRGSDGGNGGSGGSSFGGGIYGVVHLTNCTVTFNSAFAGAGGAGGAGGSAMPPDYSGQPGSVGNSGTAGGAGINGDSFLIGTLLATNQPGGNCSGVISDGGFNLSSDATGAFTHARSLNITDPLLGPLTNNGGNTLTMALLAGSPAIDAGDNSSVPPADQRNIPRPFGSTADIGAYEYAALLRISRSTGNRLDILLRDGFPGETCRLLTGTTVSNWVCAATNQIGLNGTFLFQENCDTSEPQRFYKVVLP